MSESVYKIYDTKTDEYWSSHIYLTTSAAKGVMTSAGSRPLGRGGRFKDQDRYVLHEFKLELVK